MTIGIEAERANTPNPAGPERYAAELIRNLAKLDTKNHYILYFRTEPQQWFYDLPENFKIKVIPFPKFWTQIRISWEMLWHPVDILLILAATLPLIHAKKSVVTIHDIAYELFEGIYTGFMNYYQKFSSRFAAKHAVKLLSVSQATKDDLIRTYKTDPDKITVTPLGLADGFRPINYEEVQPILDKYELIYQKYILFVGTIQPRKNIPRLVEAYQKIKEQNHIEEKLIIAGGRGWLWEPILKQVKTAGIDGSVKYLDYIPKQDLPYLIAGARLLTLPALYEGFGIPPLEAMASGVPVVVSNLSSLPEVVGDAGVLVDPNSIDSIADGLLKVIADNNLRLQMIAKGLERAKQFTWENTARKTLEVLESLK
ncbi:MAG TPA: glycosyltransferase family 1 protein [Patescibacteria group bacterium]